MALVEIVQLALGAALLGGQYGSRQVAAVGLPAVTFAGAIRPQPHQGIGLLGNHIFDQAGRTAQFAQLAAGGQPLARGPFCRLCALFERVG